MPVTPEISARRDRVSPGNSLIGNHWQIGVEYCDKSVLVMTKPPTVLFRKRLNLFLASPAVLGPDAVQLRVIDGAEASLIYVPCDLSCEHLHSEQILGL